MPLESPRPTVKILLDRSSIVLVGSFNPTIFQPAWFGHHQLLRDAEASDAKVEFINPQLSHFKTDWLEVQVTRDRFMVLNRNGGYEEPLLDLVISVFALLEHTPVTALGMNREVQLEFATVEEWHQLGHLVAPKEPWRDLFPSPGLIRLHMQGNREGKDNRLNVFVTSTGERRADIDVNEHRIVKDAEGASGATRLLREEWQPSSVESARIVRALIERIP